MKLNIQIVFHAPWLRTAFWVGMSLMAGMIISGLTLVASAATPNLPEDLQKASSQRLTLVDFYSPYCGTCIHMEPYLKKLQAKTGNRVFYKRLDITQTKNQALSEAFQIDGTPTYVLFNENGQAIYRMQDMISPSILEAQILRRTGQLAAISFPKDMELPAGGAADEPILLMTFGNKNCQTCNQMKAYLNGFEMAGAEQLKILQLDTDTASGAAVMKVLAVRQLPTYVLLDNRDDSKEELMRLEGNIKPQDLWQLIQMFNRSGI